MAENDDEEEEVTGTSTYLADLTLYIPNSPCAPTRPKRHVPPSGSHQDLSNHQNAHVPADLTLPSLPFPDGTKCLFPNPRYLTLPPSPGPEQGVFPTHQDLTTPLEYRRVSTEFTHSTPLHSTPLHFQVLPYPRSVQNIR